MTTSAFGLLIDKEANRPPVLLLPNYKAENF